MMGRETFPSNSRMLNKSPVSQRQLGAPRRLRMLVLEQVLNVAERVRLRTFRRLGLAVELFEHFGEPDS